MNTAAPEIDLRYPIGEFDASTIDRSRRPEYIQTYSELPQKLAAAIEGLSDEQLDTPYRPGGWTLRQTVHHLAESHMNGFMRVKLALTEDLPIIKPYLEDRWAELPDAKMPVELSMNILEGVHARVTHLLRNLADAEFERKFIHPDTGEWTVEGFIALYAWHSQHHTAHITELRKRNGW